MIKKLITSFIAIFLITGCGFKVAKIEKISSFYISEVKTSGDSRVNYKLKNKLLQNSQDIDKQPAFVTLKTIKTKTIKEKNIKNEITKYNISISVNVDVSAANNRIIRSFTAKRMGSYLVKTKHSETMNNEKKLTDTLSNKLSSEIQNKIISILNDI